MSKQTCVSCAKMVVLSKAQLKNKKIEGVIQNLWELSKQNVEFKLELTLEYGSLLLDNQKMSTLEEKEGLAAACLRKYIEIEKLPNPLSKMTQIQAYNWLQTQIRLDQKLIYFSNWPILFLHRFYQYCASVTRPERPLCAKDEVQPARRASE